MIQLILHGIGDYFLQTDWQALNKKNKGKLGLWACLKHCIIYSLLFVPVASWKALLIIFSTHFIIDRTNIIAYAIAIKNGTYKKPEPGQNIYLLKYDISNFGYSPERPFAITIWLYIICDNLTHIICNYLALKYF